MNVHAITSWIVLLDAASEGGLEPLIAIGDTGHGSLSFQIWLDGATPAGLRAANLATKLFDQGGQDTTEIFEHCLNLGCVYRQHADGERMIFAGPMTRALADIRARSELLQ